MANKTIDALPLGTTLLGTEELPIWQSGATAKSLISSLPGLFPSTTTPAPGAAPTVTSSVSVPAGVVWNYWSAPLAGMTSTFGGSAFVLNASSVINGGSWGTNNGVCIDFVGSTAALLHSTVLATAGNTCVSISATVTGSKILGNNLTSLGDYGILTNTPGVVDGLIIGGNDINVIGGNADAIELNSPGIKQQNAAIFGNTMTSAEFAVGIAAFSNVAIVGNVIKGVTGTNATEAFHIEDSQHSLAFVGNVGHWLNGPGFVTEAGRATPNTAEGIVACGNNLQASFGQITGSTATNVLTVTAVALGRVAINQYLQGAGIAPTTYYITSQLTGTPNGIGTYQLSGSIGTVASETIYLVSNYWGYQPVSDSFGSLQMCTVTGNHFSGFLGGLYTGAQDTMAFGNSLEGQQGAATGAAITIGSSSLWGTNLSSNYPTLTKAGAFASVMCGKVVSTTKPTDIVINNVLQKGFAFPLNTFTLTGGVDTIPLFKTPTSAWGRLSICMWGPGGNSYFHYSATILINSSAMTSITDTRGAASAHNVTFGSPAFTISGGFVNLVITELSTVGQPNLQIDFEGEYSVL